MPPTLTRIATPRMILHRYHKRHVLTSPHHLARVARISQVFTSRPYIATHFSRIARSTPFFTLRSHRYRSLLLTPQFASLLSRGSANTIVPNVTPTLTRFAMPLLYVTIPARKVVLCCTSALFDVPFRVSRGSASPVPSGGRAPVLLALAPRTPRRRRADAWLARRADRRRQKTKAQPQEQAIACPCSVCVLVPPF